MTVTVKHSVVTGAGSNPRALVDGPAWDAAHVVTGLENVQNVDTTNAGNITSGTLNAARLPLDYTNANNITSGTLNAARLPAPTSSTLGGVKSLAAVTHKFLTQIGTDGTPAQAQPAFTDVSGTAAIAQGGTGQITASAGFDALSPTTTRGDMVSRGASSNQRIGLGTSGYALLSNGTDPAWTGFVPSGTGAVTRTWQDKASDFINAKDFGLSTSNTGAQNVTAWNAAIAHAVAVGGLTLHIPAGTYNFNGSIDVSSANNLRVTGDGPDATILQITSATANFITSTGDTYYQSFDNLSLTSSVPRTAGAMINFGFFRRGLIHRVRIQQHFDGITLQGFEQSALAQVFIVNPSGGGTAITCGSAAGSNQGSNLTIFDCFLRGFNDVTQVQPPTGLVGVAIYDVQAVWIVNTDIGNFKDQAMVIAPQTAVANCYFLQTFFDGTNLGDNVLVQGTGSKNQIQFTGCWFNGAGRCTTPQTNDCCGINATNNGTYSDWNITGCRFFNASGPGFLATTPNLGFTFSGCVFTNCGVGAGTLLYGLYFASASSATITPIVVGCKFQGTGGSIDLNIASTAAGVVLAGNDFDKGVTPGAALGGVAGNRGFLDHNSGTATIATSTAGLAVNHGLSQTPASSGVIVWPITSPGASGVTGWWVDTIGSTSFTIRTSQSVTTTALQFGWKAYIPGA